MRSEFYCLGINGSITDLLKRELQSCGKSWKAASRNWENRRCNANLTALDLHIAIAQSDTEVGVWDREADSEHVITQTKQLLNISVDGDLHRSLFLGQSRINVVLARLEDWLFELDDQGRSVQTR